MGSGLGAGSPPRGQLQTSRTQQGGGAVQRRATVAWAIPGRSMTPLSLVQNQDAPPVGHFCHSICAPRVQAPSPVLLSRLLSGEMDPDRHSVSGPHRLNNSGCM